MRSSEMDSSRLTGRNRRLFNEWKILEEQTQGRDDIAVTPLRFNPAGLPVSYEVEYRIRSICAVGGPDACGENPPLFADRFIMRIDIPDAFPCIDAPVAYRFLTRDGNGREIAHPWHPNVRYSGDFAGRVCVNSPDTWQDIAWAVFRIASYLRYETYHAINEPPYPEDRTVAAWVVRQGEKNDWTVF